MKFVVSLKYYLKSPCFDLDESKECKTFLDKSSSSGHFLGSQLVRLFVYIIQAHRVATTTLKIFLDYSNNYLNTLMRWLITVLRGACNLSSSLCQIIVLG